MRIASIILATSFVVSASPDMPSGTSWGAEARSTAMGHAFWSDSTNWNLYDLAGHSSILPGLGSKSLELRVGSQGLDASGSGVKTSQNMAGMAQIRGAVENKAGYRLDLNTTSQTQKLSEFSPKYETSRLRWGFDLGTAFGPDRLVSLGLGTRFRLPSDQTQDTSGIPTTAGSFERWQPGLEALRVGMGVHFAQAITLAGKLDASIDVDTLLHTPISGQPKSLHRFVVARFPIISLSAQADRADWPVQGIGDITFGTTRRIGVMKSVDPVNPANVDFPTLQGDSVRILAGALGRWNRGEHSFRPLLTFEHASSRVQAYAPVPGTKDVFAKGELLRDTGWTMSSESAILGGFYSWNRGVSGSMELSSTKRNLEIDKGMDQPNESHTDLGMSMGVELSHRLVPALREKVASSMEFLLRLGWERRSLSGTGIERGYLGDMTMGYEPVGAYQQVAADLSNHRGWQGQEQEVGLAPSLGGGSDLNLVSYGIGATFLDRSLEFNAALQSGSWTPDGGKDLDVFGWRTELRWSP